MSFDTITGSRSTPIRNTAVGTRAATTQSTGPSVASSASCAVNTANAVEAPRCVTGMPATPGTPIDEVTPGTTSNGTPASASASISSPPRPNTNGSPPLRRTTVRPARACATSWAWMVSWRSSPGAPGARPA
jgi:hypothetical protein